MPSIRHGHDVAGVQHDRVSDGLPHVRPQQPHVIGREDAHDLAEQILRMPGMDPGSAQEVAHRPLPPTLAATRP